LPRYEALSAEAAFIEPTLLMTPESLVAILAAADAAPARRAPAARPRWPAYDRDPHGLAARFLDRWFESDQLKATLATDAIIGAKASPSTPGPAYVLFHHVMGECNGVRGVWGYVRGGMGGISEALASAARERGAEIRTDAEVRRILVDDGRARGVVLADGTEISCPVIISGCDPAVTFLELIERAILPAEFLESVARIDY
jgi:phytoene dehydrogenase-like protein